MLAINCVRSPFYTSNGIVDLQLDFNPDEMEDLRTRTFYVFVLMFQSCLDNGNGNLATAIKGPF